MSQTFEALSQATKVGIQHYSRSYLENIKEIVSEVANPMLIKSRVNALDSIHQNSLLRCSLMFNDLTLLNWRMECDGVIQVLMPSFFKEKFGMENVRIGLSSEILNKLGLSSNILTPLPAFKFPTEPYAEEAIKDLQEFIKAGRVLLQPDRYLMFMTPDDLDTDVKAQLINVDPSSTVYEWKIVDETLNPPVSMTWDPESKDDRKIFEVTIPYLSGVAFSDLFKIIEDESDLISTLRVSLSEAISKSSNEKEMVLFIRDVIDPKVDMINRKLKKLSMMRALRIAGAGVGTITLAYTAIATSGLGAVIATISGNTGLCLLGNEYAEYRRERSVIENDPYYLLWRCKQASR